MNSLILKKINNFTKNRLMEILGVVLIFISIFLLASIVSYSPSDPNFIYSPENRQINNIGGFYGSVVSDLLLQSLGLISVFLVFNFFYWGIKIFNKKTISNFITKIFFILIYIGCGTVFLNKFDIFFIIIKGKSKIFIISFSFILKLNIKKIIANKIRL